MKAYLFTTIEGDTWKEKFLKGIQEGTDVGHQSGDESVILTQGKPFWIGNKYNDNGDFLIQVDYIIEFEKELKYIYIDRDDYYEARVPDNIKTYGGYKSVKGLEFFGSYVKDIKPNEIIDVHLMVTRNSDDREIIKNILKR